MISAATVRNRNLKIMLNESTVNVPKKAVSVRPTSVKVKKAGTMSPATATTATKPLSSVRRSSTMTSSASAARAISGEKRYRFKVVLSPPSEKRGKRREKRAAPHFSFPSPLSSRILGPQPSEQGQDARVDRVHDDGRVHADRDDDGHQD